MPVIDSWKLQGSGTERGAASDSRALLWLLLPTGIIALLLRLTALGEMVLTQAEAQNAWPAWATVHGIAWEPAGPRLHAASPLLNNALWLLFQCVDGGDALARAVPALLGSLLVFLPWFFRRWLGHWGTSAAMILLAFDSWQLAFSRLADGAILSSFFAMALLACMEGTGEASEGGYIQGLSARSVSLISAVILALFAASSPEFWSFAPPIAAYFLLAGGRVRRGGGGVGVPAQRHLREFMAVFGVSLFLALSLFGARWENIQALGSSLTEWLRTWVTTAPIEHSVEWMLVRILREQPLTLVAGAAGLLTLWRGLNRKDSDLARRRALALFLWILWGMILTLRGGRGPAGLLIMNLPLKLAAAVALGRWIPEIAARCCWLTWLKSILPGVGILAAVFLWMQLYYRSSTLSDLAIRICLVSVASAFLLFPLFRQVRFKQQMTTVLIMALFAAEMNGSWQLARQVSTEPVFFDAIGHPDLRTLESDVRQWVLHYRETKRNIRIHVDNDVPGGSLSSWYLRDFIEPGNGPTREDSGRDTTFVTRDGSAAQPAAESAPPVPYRVNMQRLPEFNSWRQGSIQQRSEVVLLWLPRE